MGDGGVRAPPYETVGGLVRWAVQPGIWHELDGQYLGRGVDLGDLPFDRFLNILYYELTQRLDYDPGKEGDAERARKELDAKLKVKRWRIDPGAPDPLEGVQEDPGAPWWWDGDEEASQSFLAAQGVSLGK